MKTIFAPITSPLRTGISLIRISGSETKNCLRALGFKGEAQHQKISLQKLKEPQSGEIIDEALVSFFKAPHSFTGEDVAEISIHASPFILRKILEILANQPDARFAEAGEFSKRAFLNGKVNLTQAEAIPDLIAAETAVQHRQAMLQLSGKLGEIYENWRFRLVETSALLEAAIDFPDEDLPKNIIDKVEGEVAKLAAEIKNHLNDNHLGQKIKSGLNLAIIGAPNVGKSSLLNFLAQSDVAIVSEIAGTTRDIIETHLDIAGVAVKISDTAGIRETQDKIEAEGIRRALKKAAEADIKILMIDATKPLINHDLLDENTLILANKIDLSEFNVIPENEALKISLTQNINLEIFLKKLEEMVLKIVPQLGNPTITQERYRVSLKNSLEFLENFSLKKNIELAAEDLRMAAREIGKITGKVDIENILDVIFSRFCIGK
jgi:tRNA modification GTPase